MWRVNWIHPFRDGNGRTSRAASYLVLTVRLGQILPGEPTIADQIVENKIPYYDALDDADAAWRQQRLDLSAMEHLIEKLLEKQLSDL
jgi:Fic family protein